MHQCLATGPPTFFQRIWSGIGSYFQLSVPSFKIRFSSNFLSRFCSYVDDVSFLLQTLERTSFLLVHWNMWPVHEIIQVHGGITKRSSNLHSSSGKQNQWFPFVFTSNHWSCPFRTSTSACYRAGDKRIASTICTTPYLFVKIMLFFCSTRYEVLPVAAVDSGRSYNMTR